MNLYNLYPTCSTIGLDLNTFVQEVGTDLYDFPLLLQSLHCTFKCLPPLKIGFFRYGFAAAGNDQKWFIPYSWASTGTIGTNLVTATHFAGHNACHSNQDILPLSMCISNSSSEEWSNSAGSLGLTLFFQLSFALLTGGGKCHPLCKPGSIETGWVLCMERNNISGVLLSHFS